MELWTTMFNIKILIQIETIQPYLAQQVVNMLREEYKDTTIINCVLPR